MNWSTRLRRWVRIRTPPVREPSTKPSAATVLPEPVACSNQKRRLAPGSSGASATRSAAGSSQSWGSSSSGASASSSSATSSAAPVPAVALELGGDRRTGPSPSASAEERPAPFQLSAATESSSSAVSAARVPESTSTWCSVSSAPSASSTGSAVEQPLEPEQQRVAPPPLGRGGLAAGVELRQRGLDGAVARGPGSDVVDGLAVEQDRLARELAHALELIGCDRAGRARCDVDGFRHERSSPAPRARVNGGGGAVSSLEARRPARGFPS